MKVIVTGATDTHPSGSVRVVDQKGKVLTHLVPTEHHPVDMIIEAYAYMLGGGIIVIDVDTGERCTAHEWIERAQYDVDAA